MARYDAEASEYSADVVALTEDMTRRKLAPGIDVVAEAYEAGRKAGAEEMRERAAMVCAAWSGNTLTVTGRDYYDEGREDAADDCADAIRALPTEPGEEVGT